MSFTRVGALCRRSKLGCEALIDCRVRYTVRPQVATSKFHLQCGSTVQDLKHAQGQW